MQQRVKEIFQEYLDEDNFSRELYKEVKKQAKKLDQISELEARPILDSDQQKKLKSKVSLQSSLEERLRVFDIYKKSLNKENISENNKVKKQDLIQSEHKVIECSILSSKEPVATASKEVQSVTANAQKEHTAPGKVLVKDKESQLEAIKLVTSIFIIGSNVAQIQSLLHQQKQSDFLTQDEIFILQKFFFYLLMDPSRTSLKSKVDYATEELSKVFHEQDQEQLKAPVRQNYFNHANIKMITQKILENERLSTESLISMPHPSLHQPQMQPMEMRQTQYVQNEKAIPQNKVYPQPSPQKQVEQDEPLTQVPTSKDRNWNEVDEDDEDDEDEEEDRDFGVEKNEEVRDEEKKENQGEEEDDKEEVKEEQQEEQEHEWQDEGEGRPPRTYRGNGRGYRYKGGYNQRGGFDRNNWGNRGGRGEFHERGRGEFYERGRGDFHDRGRGDFHDRGRGDFQERGRGEYHHRGGRGNNERGRGNYRGRGSNYHYGGKDFQERNFHKRTSDEFEQQDAHPQNDQFDADGYQVVTKRHEKKTMPAYSEQSGPRQARGGLRGSRGWHDQRGRGGFDRDRGGRGEFRGRGRGGYHHNKSGEDQKVEKEESNQEFEEVE